MASIRLQLQTAVQYDLLIHHMDVKSAYLNAPFDYEIYVEWPEGFKGKNGYYVWKLKKSLYGLKQRGQTWNKTFHTYLTTQNLVQSPVNPSMYVQNVCNQKSNILLWVDNIQIASIQFECENNSIKMNQSRYNWEDIKVEHGILQTTLNSMWNGSN